MGRIRVSRGLPAAILAILLPTFALAQEIDLSLNLGTDGQVVTPLTAPRITLTVVNLGSGPSNGATVRTTRAFPLAEMNVENQSGCIAATGASELTWSVGTLQAGESRACTFGLRALTTATAQAFFMALRVAAVQPDPVSSNNQVSREFVLSSFQITVDAMVTANLIPAGPIANGTSRRLVVQLRNSGPAAASSIKVTSSPVPRGIVGGDSFILTPAPGSPCATFYEDLGLVTMVDVFPLAGLAGGASVDCLLDVRTSPSVSERLPVTFTASVAGIGVVDSNRSNDQSVVEIQVGFVPTAIPGPGWKLLLLLAVVMLASGIGVARSRPQVSDRRTRPTPRW